MGPPSVVINCSRGRAGGSVELCGWGAAERAKDPAPDVIALELSPASANRRNRSAVIVLKLMTNGNDHHIGPRLDLEERDVARSSKGDDQFA
jgi:hypothetical protein